jgi:hypothetical protein
VAIATALMPPLTTVGYGIATLQPTFALGALLLFLTNLSAIAFAFALVARLSGAARPLQNVQWTTAHTVAGIAAFLALATPLAMTLVQVKREARCVRRRGMRSSRFQASGHQHRANGRALAPVRRSLDKCGRHRPAICGERRTARPRSPCRQSRACGLGQSPAGAGRRPALANPRHDRRGDGTHRRRDRRRRTALCPHPRQHRPAHHRAVDQPDRTRG